MRKDLHNNIVAVTNINTVTTTTTTALPGAIIDLQNANALEYLISSGTITSGVFTPTLQHGNDPSLTDAVTVPAEQMLGTLADATFSGAGDSNKTKKVGYIPTIYRYVRLTITPSGTVNGTIGASAIKGTLYHSPEA